MNEPGNETVYSAPKFYWFGLLFFLAQAIFLFCVILWMNLTQKFSLQARAIFSFLALAGFAFFLWVCLLIWNSLGVEIIVTETTISKRRWGVKQGGFLWADLKTVRERTDWKGSGFLLESEGSSHSIDIDANISPLIRDEIGARLSKTITVPTLPVAIEGSKVISRIQLAACLILIIVSIVFLKHNGNQDYVVMAVGVFVFSGLFIKTLRTFNEAVVFEEHIELRNMVGKKELRFEDLRRIGFGSFKTDGKIILVLNE